MSNWYRHNGLLKAHPENRAGKQINTELKTKILKQIKEVLHRASR